MSSSSDCLRRTPLNTTFMPTSGLGTWQSEAGEVGKAVDAALANGIRLIDTAFMYRNEAEIGEVLEKWLKSGKIKRSELFVVTKLPIMAMRPEDVEPYLAMSLKNLKLDYVDLYLIHTPVGVVKDPSTKWMKLDNGKFLMETDTDHLGLWREMERMVDKNWTKAIGVSNFNSAQVERIMKVARIPVSVNQVECYVYFQQKKLREAMDKMGVKIMAYGPLGSPGRATAPSLLTDKVTVPSVLDNPVVLELAKKHGRTPAQILLRHLVQLGMIIIPKSVKESRIKENNDVYGFSLDKADMEKLCKLDQGSVKGRSFKIDFFKTDTDIKAMKEFPYKGADEY